MNVRYRNAILVKMPSYKKRTMALDGVFLGTH